MRKKSNQNSLNNDAKTVLKSKYVECLSFSTFLVCVGFAQLCLRKSTLGKSSERFPLVSLQDKILLGGGKGGMVTVTNDGATILKAIGVDNPAAKVLVGE